MKVLYVLSGTTLSGGVRVVYAHAALLRGLGVDAEVVSTGPPSDWAPESYSFFRRVRALVPEELGSADVAVGTLVTTVPAAASVPGAIPYHLCQGYEGLYEPARARWSEIEAIYALPTRKLVVSPHLAELIAERFGQRARLIPQPLDTGLFHPPAARTPGDGSFRVLLAGQWEVPVKGVPWALEALGPLRAELPGLRLVRLSQDAPREEIEAWPDAERHVAVPPVRVPEVFRGVDLFVGTSSEAEGFGLPALEAMACEVPCVLTDIGAHRCMDPGLQASIRVPDRDGEALRAAVRALASDPALRQRLGKGGREIALRYAPKRTGDELLDEFRSALSGPNGRPSPGR